MSVITESYSMPIITDFNDQYKNKYFCEVVQGQVSNDVRQERSASVTAGTVLPTGSIGYINENGVAVNALTGGTAANTAAIPYIVTVGTEHGNVRSEKYNSGCGLITMIPLTAGNDFMTTVFGGSITAFAPNTKLVVGSVVIDGETVGAIAPATGDVSETVVGVVRSAGDYHAGVKGVVFSAAFSL